MAARPDRSRCGHSVLDVATPFTYTSREAAIAAEERALHPRVPMHPTRLALRLLALFTLSACGDPASTPAPSSGADAEAPPPDADATRDARDASASGTIASRHPHDVGIANDPEVVFAEAFEELTIGATQARFNSETYLLNGDLMALSPDVPKRSGGVRSLALRTTDQRGSRRPLAALISDTQAVAKDGSREFQ